MAENSEEFIDQLFSQIRTDITLLCDSSAPNNEPNVRSRFLKPTTDEQVHQAQENGIPNSTARSTQWSVNLWKEWSSNRKKMGVEYPQTLPHLLDYANIDYWMCKFILEVRRQDGKEYPPNTLYQIVCGIMRHLRKYCPEVNAMAGNNSEEFMTRQRTTVKSSLTSYCHKFERT